MSGAGGVSVRTGTPRSVELREQAGGDRPGHAEHDERRPGGQEVVERRGAATPSRSRAPRGSPASGEEPADLEPVRQRPRDTQVELGAPATADDREPDRVHAPRLAGQSPLDAPIRAPGTARHLEDDHPHLPGARSERTSVGAGSDPAASAIWSTIHEGLVADVHLGVRPNARRGGTLGRCDGSTSTSTHGRRHVCRLGRRTRPLRAGRGRASLRERPAARRRRRGYGPAHVRRDGLLGRTRCRRSGDARCRARIRDVLARDAQVRHLARWTHAPSERDAAQG